jgi:hypothetical protein
MENRRVERASQTWKRLSVAMGAVAVLSAGLVGAGTATASATGCHVRGLGGNTICKYGESWTTWPNGARQVFVIGTNYSVYTRWQRAKGGQYVGWTSMGGKARSKVAVHHASSASWKASISVTGTDGNTYFRDRGNTRSSGWGSWRRPCSDTRASTMTLHGTGNEYDQVTHYTDSGQVVVDPPEYHRKNVNTGSVSVTIQACKDLGTKKWAPLTYTVNTDLRDLNLITKGRKVTPVPANGDRGFGVMVGRVTKNRVEVQPLMCVKKPTKASVLGVAKFVTALPIPVSKALAVGLYVAHNALPEQKKTYPCGLLGKVTAIPWSLSSTGKARLSMPKNGYVFSQSATWTLPCSQDRYCGMSHRQVLRVK